MDVFSTKCPSCSAKIPFDPKTQLWVCDYCGEKFTAEQIKSFEEQSKNENESQSNTFEINEEESLQEDYDIDYGSAYDLDCYTCENCGAQIVADQNTSATFCVYCGGYSLIKDRLTGKFAPQYIIPFKATKDEAKAEYLKFIKSRLFVPNSFKSEHNIEKITGVYIPFWSYSSDIHAIKSGTGTSVQTWTTGNYKYTKTTEYEFDRDVETNFKNVPVDGSQKFDDDLMDSIEPFDFNKSVEFDPRYLSGFLAEKYDVDKNEAYKRAQLRMCNTTSKIIDNSIGYPVKSVTQNNMTERLGKVDYYLLPVYMLNTDYKGTKYLFAMNGESKKVVGNFPTDKGKVAALYFALTIVTMILVYIAEAVLQTENLAFIAFLAIAILTYMIVVHVLFCRPKNTKEVGK